MGKAKILSGGSKGLYNIELIKSTSKITDNIAAITTRLTILAKTIPEALSVKSAAQSILEDKLAAFNSAIYTYSLKLNEQGDVNKAHAEFIKAQSAYQAAEVNYSLLLQEKESKTKEKALLQAALVVETRDAIWCADYTTDLAAGAEVGTIEINGETKQLLVYPGGSNDKLRSSLIQRTQASSAAGIFYNLAVMAGWQKWKPTYRVGEIKTLYNNDLCDVCIDEASSSVQGLKINQNAPKCQQDLGERSSGFSSFCDRNPSDPIVTNSDDTTIPWSQQLIADMTEINSSVNNGHTYQKDIYQYGAPEYWTYMKDGQSGDCEDFALTKLQKMLDKGYPIGALKLVTCKTSMGDGHAYLIVQTDLDDYALDLNYPLPMLDSVIPYTDKARQTGRTWYRPGVCLSNVPIEYMDGVNGDAFVEGDRVVVEFTNQNWNYPKVIGFESNPRLGAFLYANILCQDENLVGTEYFRQYKINGVFKSDLKINLINLSKIQIPSDRSKIAVLEPSWVDGSGNMADLNLTLYKNDGTFEQISKTVIPVWQDYIADHFASLGYVKAHVSFSSFGKPCFGYSADIIYIPCVALAGFHSISYLAGFIQVNISTGAIIGCSFWTYQWSLFGVPTGPIEMIRYENNFLLVDDKYTFGRVVKMLDGNWQSLGTMTMSSVDEAYSVIVIDDIAYAAVVSGTNASYSAPFTFKIFAYDLSSDDKFTSIKTLTVKTVSTYPDAYKLVDLGGKIGALISTGGKVILYSISVVEKAAVSPVQYTGLSILKSKTIEEAASISFGLDFAVG